MSDPKSFWIMDAMAVELPLAWEPVEQAPDLIFPVVVSAVADAPNGPRQCGVLVGSRVDGEWTLLGEVPEGHTVVEYFRLPMPPSVTKGRAN